jgi:hypothetical protein
MSHTCICNEAALERGDEAMNDGISRYWITRDGITHGHGYSNPKDAHTAAGVILHSAPVGTRIAVTHDHNTGTRYDVLRSPERGIYISVKEIR